MLGAQTCPPGALFSSVDRLIFANWTISKVEQNRGRVYCIDLTNEGRRKKTQSKKYATGAKRFDQITHTDGLCSRFARDYVNTSMTYHCILLTLFYKRNKGNVRFVVTQTDANTRESSGAM